MQRSFLTLIQKPESIEKLKGILENVFLLEFVSRFHCSNFTKI